jgi:hypothetical protein
MSMQAHKIFVCPQGVSLGYCPRPSLLQTPETVAWVRRPRA